MIILTDKPLVVGTIAYGVADSNGHWQPDQPCFVLRTATREEWLQEVMSLGPLTRQELQLVGRPDVRFYEVSID